MLLLVPKTMHRDNQKLRKNMPKAGDGLVTLVLFPFDYLLLPPVISKTANFVHNSSIVWYKLLDQR